MLVDHLMLLSKMTIIIIDIEIIIKTNHICKPQEKHRGGILVVMCDL